MAASTYSATNSISLSNSTSIIIDFHLRSRNSKLFFTRSSLSFRPRKRLTVNNVASNQRQQLEDLATKKEGEVGSLDSFLPDSASVASSIKYHAEFTPSFSLEQFELPKAFYATAESVRDMIIINWNATYDYYEK
ncbi:unnamed protein product [Ilex paraguariensis]|uniref:Uncharacterized protein n=1 Tax=Ilex paraguariensis TaxID=185542 RepID=A0ABC8UYM8_9AQUA